MKKVFLIVVLVFLIPFYVYAEDLYDITYDDAKLMFTIDEDLWEPISTTDEFENYKWKGKCGTLAVGVSDFYSDLTQEDLGELTRKDINYKNLFENDQFGSTIAKEYGIDNWEYVDYGVRFIKLVGTYKQNNQAYKSEVYITVNNGYILMFNYIVLTPDGTAYCEIASQMLVLETVKPIGRVSSITNEIDFYSPVEIIIGILLTAVVYMAYPFYLVVIKKKYLNKKEAKKIALLNSLILGGIFLVITMLSGNGVAWSAGPAFLYYLINSTLYAEKNKENATTSKIAKNESSKKSTAKKPFNSVNNIDEKYEVLKKLKQMLDEEIISKAEYEKEKKKILDNSEEQS